MTDSLKAIQDHEIISLCKTLTDYLYVSTHKLDSDGLFFLSVKYTEQWSQYYGLTDVYANGRPQQYLQRKLKKTGEDIPSVMKLCYRIGVVNGELRHTENTINSRHQEDIQHLKTFGDLIEQRGLRDLFIIRQDFSEAWFKAATYFLRTLEAVRFVGSQVASRCQSELPCTFCLFDDIWDSVRTAQERDPIFDYGCFCEKLLLTNYDNLYCYYFPRSSCNGDSVSWALCLWASGNHSELLQPVLNTIQTMIRSYWQGGSIRDLTTEIEHIKKLEINWNQIYESMLDEARKSARPEGQNRMDELGSLNKMFKRSQNKAARKLFVEFMQTKQNEGVVVEAIDLTKAKNILSNQH